MGKAVPGIASLTCKLILAMVIVQLFNLATDGEERRRSRGKRGEEATRDMQEREARDWQRGRMK